MAQAQTSLPEHRGRHPGELPEAEESSLRRNRTGNGGRTGNQDSRCLEAKVNAIDTERLQIRN